jgi:hypothetical protein
MKLPPLVLMLLMAASCGGDRGEVADARVVAIADAPVIANASMLWLHGVNGSESNLELIPTGPPPPF